MADVETRRPELVFRVQIARRAAGAVLEVAAADQAARPRVARVAVRVGGLEEQTVGEATVYACDQAVVPGIRDVRARADAAPRRIGERRARDDVPVAVGRIE